jgi:Putative zinc-finger
MNHQIAERTMAVEKYLLDELSPEEKDAFEEHFFSCDECAREIKTGAAFMAHAKESLKGGTAQRAAGFVVGPSEVKPHKRDWFAWLRPVYAVPAMALMAGVLIFQNLVQLPAMQHSLIAMNTPAVLPNADLKSGSSRGEENVVVARAGEIFQLTIDIPDAANAAHTAELYDSSGRKLWSLAIPEDAPKDGLALKMPGDLPEGSYSLVVKQADGGSGEVSRYSFGLRRRS